MKIYQAPNIGLNISVNEALLMALLDGKNHLENVPRVNAGLAPRGTRSHLGNVESGKALIKNIPLDEKIEQVSSAHELQYLEMRVSRSREPSRGNIRSIVPSRDDHGPGNYRTAERSTPRR